VESALREGGRDPELRLIETLAWDGAAPVREGLHLARLARGAAALGWACDTAAAAATLRAGRDTTPARLRLTLDGQGAIAVTAAPMPPPAKLWRLGLAAQRLEAGDPWLGLKTTRRAAYDAARAGLPSGLDEVILCNGAGQVCDGSITTVFFDRGQGLRTPPLACGLLPGIMRQTLLDSATAREEVLMTVDLPHVRLWVGNALRGLIPAVWAG
jgi:4-amino-4-deoxychorismate lyase